MDMPDLFCEIDQVVVADAIRCCIAGICIGPLQKVKKALLLLCFLREYIRQTISNKACPTDQPVDIVCINMISRGCL